MPPLLLGCDLGTSSCKAALFEADGTLVDLDNEPYPTLYPGHLMHEQLPDDWWRAFATCVRRLIARRPERQVAAVALSGQSLAVVPVDSAGRLLRQTVPIWSDARARGQADQFFRDIPEHAWYLRTGNGFPPELYSVFELMWLHDQEPQLLQEASAVIGSKDFINLRMTGVAVTDHTYASGSGVYDLAARHYAADLIAAAGLPRHLFPTIVRPTDKIGGILPGPASELGLAAGTPVFAGAVDNSCMAIGARGISEGSIYNALGSSNWITVTSARPVLDLELRPFVFDHAVPGFYISALSIFGGGSSMAWLARQFFAGPGEDRPMERLLDLAAEAQPGARGLLFLPTLAGGTATEGGPAVRGALLGLGLEHTRSDIARAGLEGVALGMRRALRNLARLTPIGEEMLLVGGGSRDERWRQILADVYRMRVIKTNVDQEAAALGSAAIAAVGAGLWPDFTPVLAAHSTVSTLEPTKAAAAVYDAVFDHFLRASDLQRELS